MKLLILLSITITSSARTRPIGGLDHLINNDVNEISTSTVELPPDFAEKLLLEINRIRICHNAISTGPVVNEACFDDDSEQNVHKHVRRSGRKTKKASKNGKQNKLKNRRSKQKRSERRRKRNRNQSDE